MPHAYCPSEHEALEERGPRPWDHDCLLPLVLEQGSRLEGQQLEFKSALTEYTAVAVVVYSPTL